MIPIGPVKLFGSHARLSEVFKTMTGVCGPYNFGGSVTAGIRAIVTRVIEVFFAKLQNDLDPIK